MDLKCPYPLYRIDKTSGAFRLLPESFQATERNGGIFISKEQADILKADFGLRPENIQELRCGQCLNCRLHKSREWAVRCCHEAMYHKHNYFITLTYNDAFLPYLDCIDYNGNIHESTLCRDDLVNFVKRYRKYEHEENNNDNLRVFYCGEYGELHSRPHYHIILFGATELTDLKFWSREEGFTHYTSDVLTKRWSAYDRKLKTYIPMGISTVSGFSFDTAAYVARYTLKKVSGLNKKDFLEYYSTLRDPLPLREQEFVGMSRRPGIGYQYFKEHSDDIYETDSVIYNHKFKAFTSKPPRYYDKLFDIDNPDRMSEVKEIRTDLALRTFNPRTEPALEANLKSLERNKRAREHQAIKL